MFDAIDPHADLPQDVLHACAQDLNLLNDLFSAVSEANLALSESAICGLTRRLRGCASAIERIAVQITPGARQARI